MGVAGDGRRQAGGRDSCCGLLGRIMNTWAVQLAALFLCLSNLPICSNKRAESGVGGKGRGGGWGGRPGISVQIV